MADSFFGFDTTLPSGDLGDDINLQVPEDQYDALNDQTFGDATNGDWEDIHENLVRMENNRSGIGGIDDDDGSDIELNFTRMGLDDCDVGTDDGLGRVQLDPSVWATPFQHKDNNVGSMYGDPDMFLKQNFSHPFNSNGQTQSPIMQHMSSIPKPQQNSMPIAQPKFMSVEDLERNIRNQQQQQIPNLVPSHAQEMMKQQPLGMSSQPIQSPVNNVIPRLPMPPGIEHPNQKMPPQLGPQQMQPRPLPPPGLGNAPHRFRMFPYPPGQQPNRLPPVMPFMRMDGQQHPNMQRLMNPNMPSAMNNFVRHPNFNALRQMNPQMQPGMQQPPPPPNQMQRMPPHMMGPNPNYPPANQYNKRLMQEIQQNHPMLPFNRMNGPQNFSGVGNPNPMGNIGHQQQQSQQNNINNRQQYHSQQFRSNGNITEPFDEYANLMSNREKHWLINIQLSQLNTDTPYADDYYYTAYKEKKANLKGEKENRAHKDNQMNHPFSQPKGHAHLVMLSMGRNGSNQRNHNGQQNNGRERKCSESKNEKENQRSYSPLQFENSLGKLQVGSVTAPRKIIDMEVVGPEMNSGNNISSDVTNQKKSKQILLHIETLYRVVIKLEDLENPVAVHTAILVRAKKEKEYQMALEQAMNKDSENNLSVSLTIQPPPKPEDRPKLMKQLISGLTADRVTAMMVIRKGRLLLLRIMPQIQEEDIRWDVWCSIISTASIFYKKDKSDGDEYLMPFITEFENQVSEEGTHDSIKKIMNVLKICFGDGLFPLNNKFYVDVLAILIKRLHKLSRTDDLNIKNNFIWPEWSEFMAVYIKSSLDLKEPSDTKSTVNEESMRVIIHHADLLSFFTEKWGHLLKDTNE